MALKELTKEEKQILPALIDIIKERKGKSNAINNNKICEVLNYSYHLNIIWKPVRIRKMVNYLRNKDLLLHLCSNSKGYFIAANEQELDDCIASQTERVGSAKRTLDSLTRQKTKFGLNTKPGEQTNFKF